MYSGCKISFSSQTFREFFRDLFSPNVCSASTKSEQQFGESTTTRSKRVYNHPFPLESATTGSMEYVADGLDLRTMGMTQISPWHETGIDSCDSRSKTWSA